MTQPRRWERARHGFGPHWDEASRVLILGSFPSVRSRADGFYYAYPMNRFWRVLASLFDAEVPSSIEAKRVFLTQDHIALWDVIDECEVSDSSDASIRSVVPCDLTKITNTAPIELIALNGGTAARFFARYWHDIGIESVRLPSTSPANAAWTLDKLIDAWRVIVRDRPGIA